MTSPNNTDLEQTLGPELQRRLSAPPAALADQMIGAAIAAPRARSFVGSLVSWPFAAVVTVILGGVTVGFLIGIMGSLGPSAGTGETYRAPTQQACRQVPPSTHGCVVIGAGLPAADLTRGGWDYRCPDGSCWIEGYDALLAALPNLLPLYEGVRDRELGASGVPLRIEFSSEAGLAWHSDEEQGVAQNVSVDLTLLALGEGPAFVMPNDTLTAPPGALPAYELPDDLGRAILEAFFRPVD
jgi:hypothetical protein